MAQDQCERVLPLKIQTIHTLKTWSSTILLQILLICHTGNVIQLTNIDELLSKIAKMTTL